MKKLVTTLCLTALTLGAFAQGTVNFSNAGALISAGGTATIGPGYIYGLFIGGNSTDPSTFTFTGVYATNHPTAAGRLSSRIDVVVPGWAGDTVQNYLVRGWSANLGTDWSVIAPQVAGNVFASTGFYNESPVAFGRAGGANNVPSHVLFGGATGLPGFNLAAVEVIPEPSSLALLGLGAAALLIRRRK